MSTEAGAEENLPAGWKGLSEVWQDFSSLYLNRLPAVMEEVKDDVAEQRQDRSLIPFNLRVRLSLEEGAEKSSVHKNLNLWMNKPDLQLSTWVSSRFCFCVWKPNLAVSPANKHTA